MNKIRFLMIVLLISGAVAGGVFFASKNKNTLNLSLDYQNTSKVIVLTKEDFQAAKFDNPVAIITPPSKSIKLKKGNYTLYYVAANGYANGQVEGVDLTTKDQSVKITPPYSAERLDSMLSPELNDIRQAIKDQVPGVATYIIGKGSLYSTGEWYGTVLIYNGKDYYNADSLRLVMKKEGTTWKLVTPTPQITLSKYVFPDIPDDVLSGVNSLDAPIQSKYVD